MAEDFVRKNKKWKIGLNPRAEEGGDFFVSIGTSGIAFDNSFANFGDARQDAFDIAFLESKKQFIKFMGQQISTNIVNERKQGSYAQPPEPGTSEMEKLMDEMSSFEEGKKLRTLINLKLDQALRDAGYEDPSTLRQPKKQRKLLKQKNLANLLKQQQNIELLDFKPIKFLKYLMEIKVIFQSLDCGVIN